MFDRKQVLHDLSNDKKSASPNTTQRTQRASLDNFENFTQEKYKESIHSISENLAKETDIRVACGVIQAWIRWSTEQNLAPNTIRTRFWFIKDFLYDQGIELTNLQVKKNIRFPKIAKEELYAVSNEELRKIVDIATPTKKSLFLTQSSCGARIGELVQVRKKDIDTDGERWKIKIRSETTKTKSARTTFMSKEAMKYSRRLLESKDDDDLVWGVNVNPIHSIVNEQSALRGYLDKLGMGKKNEKNSYRKITTHSFRAYFFTRAVRAIGENYAHKMTGHGGYLLEYDRYDDKKKLELYLKLEPSLLVYESYNEDVAELRDELKNVKKEMGKYKELWDESYRLGTDKEYRRQQLEPMIKRIIKRMKEELREEQLGKQPLS